MSTINTSSLKPMLKYRGGKSRELNEIKPFIPEYAGRYVEPFFGGGALFFNLAPERAIINDINQPLMNFYKGIKNEFERVSSELEELEKIYIKNRKEFEKLKSKNPEVKVIDPNEQLYYEIRKIFNREKETNLHEATIYYYINKTAYSGMVRYNKSGKYNVPYGRYKNFNTKLITPEHHKLLLNTEIYNLDYSTIFEMSNEDDFLFLDPPYDSVFSDYGNRETKEGFTEDMHRKLAEDFKNLNAKSLMVIGSTPLIEELYEGYIIHKYDKQYAVNIRNRFNSSANHILITNY